jgi:hypothetical protein
MKLIVFQNKVSNNLREVHLHQLLAYCEWAETEGSYYGDVRHFRKRHQEIVEWLKECIDMLDKPK